MHTDFTKHAPPFAETPLAPVFLGSGFAASQRPGMTV
jgi:hypothetical protein